MASWVRQTANPTAPVEVEFFIVEKGVETLISSDFVSQIRA
jgi:hypothetical protein